MGDKRKPSESELRNMAQSMTKSQISRATGYSLPSVLRWLENFEIQAQPHIYRKYPADSGKYLILECKIHGRTRHRKTYARGYSAGYRCISCVTDYSRNRARANKATLVAEH